MHTDKKKEVREKIHHDFRQKVAIDAGTTLESGISIPLRLLIFGIFFQGLRSYYGLKRLQLYYISLHILRGYIYSICQIF